MFGATAFIRYLASLDGLAPGITHQHAADLCWALMDSHLYHRLVTQRGWTTGEFTQWLSSSLAATLLRTPWADPRALRQPASGTGPGACPCTGS
jgi:hypothetical protein